MKTLEDEAKDYAEKENDCYANDYQGFINGANSKWVQAQKLKAQIEALEYIIGPELSYAMEEAYDFQYKLKLQLRKLEEEEEEE